MIVSLLSTVALADEPPIDRWWGQTQGLMAGVVVGHAIQPIGAATGAWAWEDKYSVATAGAGLYALTFGGLLAEQRWALHLSIIGPAAGATTVATLFTLGQVGVIEAEVRPDVFQVSNALLQIPAAIRAWQLLRATRTEPSAVSLAVAPNRLVLTVSL